MPTQPPRVFSREFKEAAVRRILAGEKVRALAAELQLWPKVLYDWRNKYERGGPEALLPPGRPPRSVARPQPASTWQPGKAAPKRKEHDGPPDGVAASERVAELERKVGQQALEIDFFARALRHIKASIPPSDERGARASSP